MKKIYLLVGALIVIGIATAAAIFLYRHYDQKEILETVQEWARIEAIPDSAKITSIEKLGSPASREFRITFTASEDDIREWLKKSSGTMDLTPSIEGSIETYQVTPGGGAQFAEITYDTEANEVSIRVYWS